MKTNITLSKYLEGLADDLESQRALIFLPQGEEVEDTLSYRDLDRQAKLVAAQLKDRGLVGQSVLLLYPSCNEYIVAFLACIYAGVIAVPAYPPRNNHHALRLTSIIQDAQVQAVLTMENIEDRIREQIKVNEYISTDSLESTLLGWVNKDVRLSDIAYLQYTSGSTGTPKGVMVSHFNIMANCHLYSKAVGVDEGQVHVSWLPIFHDMGLVQGILMPLFLGGTAVFMPPERFIQQPIRWLKAISKYRAVMTGGPNFAYDFCVRKSTVDERSNLDLSNWQVAVNGAEPVSKQTIENFINAFSPYGFSRKTFYPGYGMAEATLYVTAGDVGGEPVYTYVDKKELKQDRIVICEQDSTDATSIVACGRVFNDPQVLIVNPESSKLLEELQVGEIWLGGSSICSGYWKQNEYSKETFFNKLEKYPKTNFLRTGDLGFVYNDRLYITGRLKDLIIIRGENHYPQDIECTVEESHPALRKGNCGAAFTVNVDGEEKLVVVHEVERTQRKKIKVSEVAKLISRNIINAHGIQTHSIILLNTGEVPKTSSGKIQRTICRQNYLESAFNCIGQWPEPTEIDWYSLPQKINPAL